MFGSGIRPRGHRAPRRRRVHLRRRDGLLNSLEGKRGEPRLKPPFPAIEGLYGMPTVVNNVETLAYLVPILERGAGMVRRGRHRAQQRL